MSNDDVTKNSLSYWFPLIQNLVPVPKTEIITMPAAAKTDIWSLFDGKDTGGTAVAKFADKVRTIGAQMGFPFFLRTDHTSAKHRWAQACCVGEDSDVAAQINVIVEYSELAGIIGLPWDTWVVREMLPTEPIGVCPNYYGMPLCREFRVFAEDGIIMCYHSYWPVGALEQGGVSQPMEAYARLSHISDEDLYTVLGYARTITRALTGAWSVDVLYTKRGWYVTDMALAKNSWHMPGCVNANAFK